MLRNPLCSMAGTFGVLVMSLAVVPAVAAQSTGTPIYAAPYRAFANSEIGISFADPGPGFDFEGSYRTAFNKKIDLGFRGGIHSYSDPGSTALLLGTDLRARVLDHTESFPLDGSVTVGLGFESGKGYTVGFLPIGFSMGRRVLVEGSSISLIPYIQPVLAGRDLATARVGPISPLGFGLDARMTPRLDLRFSAGIGDHDGVGFTVAFLH